MLAAEKEINKICAYLNELNMVATRYHGVMQTVDGVYRRHLNALDAIININKKVDWLEFTPQERLVTQNTVLLVQLLYKMCQVKVVLKADAEGELNSVNKTAVEENIHAANTLIAERGFEVNKAKKVAEWVFDEQESYGLAVAALLYYFAGCDNSVSDEEAAIIEENIAPIIDAEVATEEMLAEVAAIKGTNPFTFSHLKKYLAHIDVAALDEFGALVEQVIGASGGISSDEKEAKAKFEDYLKERKKV